MKNLNKRFVQKIKSVSFSLKNCHTEADLVKSAIPDNMLLDPAPLLHIKIKVRDGRGKVQIILLVSEITEFVISWVDIILPILNIKITSSAI